jgi:RNA polymerase sigma-70 factor (ECF subfamily)
MYARGGFKRLVDEYIKKYGKRLYGLCLTLCAFSDEADDLYQDTWLKVLKNISQYDETKEFEPWLTKICVNTYRNKLRRIAKAPFYNRFSDGDEKDRVLESVSAEHPKDYGDLHKAIDKLPEKYRITFILFYFNDLDLKSVASTLGIPVGTVKSRLNKAKKLIKEELNREPDLQF